jgi:hypothetical protein
VLGSFVGMVSALDAKEISNAGKKSPGPQSARVSRKRILVLAVPPVFIFPLLQRWEVLTEFALES